MIASVGCSMAGSGTVSTRTSRFPCQATAFMAFLSSGVWPSHYPAPAGDQPNFRDAECPPRCQRASDQTDENERADDQQDRSGDRIAPALQPVSGELIGPGGGGERQ